MVKEVKVVKAAGQAGAGDGSKGGLSSRVIEQAMSDAAAALHEKGVWDDDEIRDAKLAARERMKRERREEEERRAAEARKAAEEE